MAKHSKREARKRQKRIARNLNNAKRSLDLARASLSAASGDLWTARLKSEGDAIYDVYTDLWEMQKRLPNVPEWWAEDLFKEK